jgi:hypothetical protein
MVPSLITFKAVLLTQSGGESADPLDTVRSTVDIFGTTVTALAIIVGGIWAYFRFVKGRPYKPRLEVDLYGQWHDVEGKRLLRAVISVRNIGHSKVTLLQSGTGLRVSALAPEQPPPPAAAMWKSVKVFEVLREHQWIEPQEMVSDDLLLDPGKSELGPVLFEARLVWRRSRRGGNIVVFARQVIPVDSTISDINGRERAASHRLGEGDTE